MPEALDAIVARATAPRPEDRFPSVRAMVEALKAWPRESGMPAAREPSPRTAWSKPAVALAAVVLAVVLVAALLPRVLGWGTRVPAFIAPPPPAAALYDVEATLERRDDRGATRLVAGDRVRPGDDLALAFRSTRPAWVYVLNEDDTGERYLLFPQPLFDARNPLPPDSIVRLPGTIGGKPNFWTVSSRGGHERFLVVASLEPVAALEQELARLPAPLPDRPVRYAAVSPDVVDGLRGIGTLTARATPRSDPAHAASGFDHFRALADRESGVRGVWVRQIVLENP